MLDGIWAEQLTGDVRAHEVLKKYVSHRHNRVGRRRDRFVLQREQEVAAGGAGSRPWAAVCTDRGLGHCRHRDTGRYHLDRQQVGLDVMMHWGFPNERSRVDARCAACLHTG